MLAATNAASGAEACRTAAKNDWQVLQQSAPKLTGQACFVPERAAATQFDGSPCDPEGKNLYFEIRAEAETKAKERSVALTLRSAPDCKGLYLVAPSPQKEQSDAQKNAESDYPKEARDALNTIVDARTPKEALGSTTRVRIRSIGKAPSTPAIGTGLPDVAAEAVQILGQIVVDRASQEAYRLATEKLKRGLKCGEEPGKNDEQNRQPPNAKTVFPATCDAIVSIRIQDLAMARDVLLRALVSDAIHAAFGSLQPLTDDQINAALAKALSTKHEGPFNASLFLRSLVFGDIAGCRTLLEKAVFTPADIGGILPNSRMNANTRLLVDFAAGTVISGLLKTISDPTKKQAGIVAPAIVAEMEAFARANVEATDERLQPLLLAGGALTKCQALVSLRQLSGLDQCDISREVDGFEFGTPRAKTVGRATARSLLVALTAKSDNRADPDKRIAAAMSATFDAMCFAVDPDRSLGCPALLDVSPSDQPQVVLPLALARGMLEAALERDTNRMVTTAIRGLDVVVIPALRPHRDTKGERRALRLLAAVVQYADTYRVMTSDDNGNSRESLHEQRTKILESLTADMTERTGRQGDLILSLGGSLSTVHGVRFGTGQAVYNGPLSLSLGLGLQHVPESGPGLHAEVGVLDLAQYLSFQSQPRDPARDDKSREVVVREPVLRDALSPSVKVGVQWGGNIPIFLAGALGYVPFYEFVNDDGSREHKGAWTASAALGAYVPLLDIN